jgi:hypothetical protein
MLNKKGGMFNSLPHIFIFCTFQTAFLFTSWISTSESTNNIITSNYSTNHLKAEETKKAEMMRHFRK